MKKRVGSACDLESRATAESPVIQVLPKFTLEQPF